MSCVSTDDGMEGGVSASGIDGQIARGVGVIARDALAEAQSRCLKCGV